MYRVMAELASPSRGAAWMDTFSLPSALLMAESCMVQGGGRLEVDESMRPEGSLRNQSGWQSIKHCCCGICHLHTPSEMLPTQHVNQPQNKPHLGVGLDVQCQGAHARTDESQIRW